LINFDKALGIHPDALQVFSRRAKIIASNMANSDTPNYKARDINFRDIISSISNDKSDSLSLSFNDSNDYSNFGELLYRVPSQPSLDGNTVDVQMETSAFTENSIRFQATMQFLSGKFKGLTKALRGD